MLKTTLKQYYIFSPLVEMEKFWVCLLNAELEPEWEVDQH